MARKRYAIPQYGTVIMAGKEYYRTRIEDADGKRVALYGRTREELYDKVLEAREQIEDNTFRRSSPTVKEYCEKWLLLQSAQVRATTLTDYTSKVNRHIIKPLGHMNIADVTADDIRLALVPVSKKSASVYKSVNILYKSIFAAAKESKVIQDNPTIYLSGKNGGVPQKEKNPLTDDQVERLLDAIRGLPPYVFVMLGLYAGLRREEILALQWDSVFLDEAAPYLTVCRAWHRLYEPSAAPPAVQRTSRPASSHKPHRCGRRSSPEYMPRFFPFPLSCRKTPCVPFRQSRRS